MCYLIVLISGVGRCIEALPCFVTPFLDLLCDATGLKASLLIGGPEPAADGRLNIIRCECSAFWEHILCTYIHLQHSFWHHQGTRVATTFIIETPTYQGITYHNTRCFYEGSFNAIWPMSMKEIFYFIGYPISL